jgi:hypothetical protein
MARRRAAAAPVTFFSFQDVLLSLIGIALVMTVIMLIESATRSVSAAAAAQADPAPVFPATEEERLLEERVSALEEAVRRAQRRPDGDPLARRSSLRAELRARAEDLASLEREKSELERQLRELLLEHPDADKLKVALELAARRDALQGELEKLERVRRIQYIVDPTAGLEPIILEVSAARVVVSELDARKSSMRIAAGTETAQATDAVALYRTLARGRPVYLFLIVKPSGIPLYQKILQVLASLPEGERPRIGVDLIPEPGFVAPLFPAAGTREGGEP